MYAKLAFGHLISKAKPLSRAAFLVGGAIFIDGAMKLVYSI